MSNGNFVGVIIMGFLDWLKGLFTSDASRRSDKKRRKDSDEEEEEIEELIAIDII
jgi:hypothetical protein